MKQISLTSAHRIDCNPQDFSKTFFFHFANPQTGNNKIIRIIKMNILRNKQLWNQKQRLYVLYLTETQNSLHVFLKTSNGLKQAFSILKNTFS